VARKQARPYFFGSESVTPKPRVGTLTDSKDSLSGLPSIPASVQKGGFFCFCCNKMQFSAVINILLFRGLTCQARFAWLLFLKSNRLFAFVYSPDCLGFLASAPCEIVW
jgi:hypothetical protein